MRYKKIILVVIIFICLLTVSAVSAVDADTNNTQILSASDNEEIVTVDNVRVLNETKSTNEGDKIVLDASEGNWTNTLGHDADSYLTKSETSDDDLELSTGSYSDLRKEIGTGGNITLTKSTYHYTVGDGITIDITKSGVIDGKGAVIDMAGSNINAFQVYAYNSTIKNLTIKNAKYYSAGGAIYFGTYGTVENCNFINNTADKEGGAIYFRTYGTVENCNFNNNKVITTKTVASSYGGAIYSQDNCTVINCDFDSNSASMGGAIYSKHNCTVINCDFDSNSASMGGAIHGGDYFSKNSIVTVNNCSFTSNSASKSGGAIYFNSGIAENCNFTKNSALEGGAICFGISGVVENCNFNNNNVHVDSLYEYGTGGAISFGSWPSVVKKCNFTKNSAYMGGAIYFDTPGSTAENCTFINNYAISGGAMYGYGNVTNCYFISNNGNHGGATYQITANNCEFTKNTAIYYGGAMYEGAVYNSVFINNRAGMGDNTYGTIVPKLVLSVSNFTSTYNSSAKLDANFTNLNGVPVTNANITVRVYTNNNLAGTYYFISGEGWIVNIDAGNYEAVFSVEDQAYDANPVNATLIIAWDSSKLSASSVTTVYNGDKYIVATLVDGGTRPISDAEVSIKFSNGKGISSKTDKNGKVKFTTNALTPVKTYTATITFEGNIYYLKSTESVNVTVKKATPKITTKAKTFKLKDKTKKYTVTLKTNQNKVMKNTKVTIKVNKKTYTAKTNSKGVATFKLTKLTKKGKYTALVKYAGSAYYKAKTVKPKITVK